LSCISVDSIKTEITIKTLNGSTVQPIIGLNYKLRIADKPICR